MHNSQQEDKHLQTYQQRPQNLIIYPIKNVENPSRTDRRSGNEKQTGHNENQRAVVAARNRETIGHPVVPQSGNKCYNCNGFGYVVKKCRLVKQVKDYAYHKEKILLYGEPEDQELEPHYIYIAKIHEVLPETAKDTAPSYDTESLEKVHSNDEYNVFANERQHTKQPKSINGTYVVEKVDNNVILDSLDMCNDEKEVEQDVEQDEDEHVLLAILIAIFKT
ncbi:hypothetical protein Tco_1152801 [Tanacetum coccineum]